MIDEEPMRQQSDTRSDEPTLDDLLWELDVTTARSDAPAPAVESPKARAPRPPKAPKAAKPSKRGRFHRPELETRWERISRNRVVQVAAGTVLVAGTAALVVAALSR
jgi:hypothetical protein